MTVFKDFPGLENLEKLFQDFQGPARALYFDTEIPTWFGLSVFQLQADGGVRLNTEQIDDIAVT